MALKLRKDIKKSLYYVWFLGAKESKGLRGSEYIIPVIKHLEQREKEVEPFKVTLQVSHKGLKIIQNIVAQGKSKPKNETIKHFIPHNTITCVYQHEDIIACILLLFNPVTKCPLHIHAYRCDSVETAGLLRQQLQVLIESPENQKKFAEIESRLNLTNKEVKKLESSLGSDTGTSTRESESSEERYLVDNNRIATLYDSVAAELRAKLNKKNEPILLPPRDYDTVHRQKGNLTGIELRRCLNASIVGQNVKAKRIESSGGSSGIGSDHPPSPDSPNIPDSRFNTLDNHSTSDEEWSNNNNDSALYLMNSPTPNVTLPRPSRNAEIPDEIYDDYRTEPNFTRYHQDPPKADPRTRRDKYHPEDVRTQEKDIAKYLEKPIAKYTDNKYLERQKSLEREKHKSVEYQKSVERSERCSDRQVFTNGHKSLEKQNSRARSYEFGSSENYYQEETDRSGKYPGGGYFDEEIRRGERDKSSKYYDDDGFDENIRYRNSSNLDKSRFSSYESEEYQRDQRAYPNPPVPKTRQRFNDDYPEKKFNRSQFIEDYQAEPEVRARIRKEIEDYRKEPEMRPRTKKNVVDYHRDPEIRVTNRDSTDSYSRESLPRGTGRNSNSYDAEVELRSKPKQSQEDHQKARRYFGEEERSRTKIPNEQERHAYPRGDKDEKSYKPTEYFEEPSKNRRNAQFRQRSPSPEVIKVSPQDRFRDAKEKFLSMERERLANQRRGQRDEPTNPNNKMSHLKRHESMMTPMKDRYDDTFYDEIGDAVPKPSPRHLEEVRYRRESPVDRYRNTDKMDPKRRSMFNLIEDEHRKNSNEIAREIKRRSYLESINYEEEMHKERERTYHELPESDRYPSERDSYSKSYHDLDKMGETKYDPKFTKNQNNKSGAGYRHSYAEPKLRMEKKNGFSEILHRTNSTVGGNGRVGIASIHPY